MENTNKMSIDTNETLKYEKPTYENYIEYNEGLGMKRENVNLDRKSEIVKLLKPKNDTESKSLDDKLLADVKFPLRHIFSIAGREQTLGIKEFDKLFTFWIKVCDSNNRELNPESRIIINKEKEIDEYGKTVIRLDTTFYKNVSITKFCKQPPNSTKSVDKLYKFEHGAEFNKDEHLCVYVIDPDIDINPENVDININLDKWNS